MKNYVLQNANKLYKEYLSPGNGIDTMVPDQNSFTSPIYLGGDEDSLYRNRGGFNGNPYSE